MEGAGLEDIEAVYRARLRSFVRVAAGIAGIEAAEDAVHEAFVGAVKARRHYAGRGSLEAWLWKAVIRSSRRMAAKRVAKAEAPLVEHASLANEADVDEGRAEIVRHVITSLPARQRLVLFLRYYADLDYETISDILGIRKGTVSATLHAAQTSVRERLDTYGVTR
jgi:RNA polymerase sigma-70 factor (ECF subfamily)